MTFLDHSLLTKAARLTSMKASTPILWVFQLLDNRSVALGRNVYVNRFSLVTLRKAKEWCQWVAILQKRSTKTTCLWVPTHRHIITRAVCQSQCTKPTTSPWPQVLWSSHPWENRFLHLPTWDFAQARRPLPAGRCLVSASPHLWTEISNPIAKVSRQ